MILMKYFLPQNTHFYQKSLNEKAKPYFTSLYYPSMNIQSMSTFHSQPNAKSPPVKFSYTSPPHHKINTYSSFMSQSCYAQNTNVLRSVTNHLNSPKINQSLVDDSKHRINLPQKWKKDEKENLLKDCKKSVSQSLIIDARKQEQKEERETQLSLNFFDTNQKLKTFQDSRLSLSTVSNSMRSDQNIEYPAQYQKNQMPRMNEIKVFNFSKTKPRQRRVQPKLCSAKIDDFLIGQMIGKGGIGRVFLVKHRNTGYYFALKIIKKAEVKDVKQLAFAIKCHFMLNHPNIAQLYACFSDANCIYLLMEVCIDGNLSKYRKKLKGDEQREYIMAGISYGVQYMHGFLLRHGDLKLQNILINHGFPKITDFDCIFKGKQIDFKQERRKSKLWGSPAYFSPGMIKQASFTLADDIWSLGIIMYEVYCNSHPFNLKDAEDLACILDKEMDQLPTDLKGKQKNLIRQMLFKDQRKRIKIDQILRYYQ